MFLILLSSSNFLLFNYLKYLSFLDVRYDLSHYDKIKKKVTNKAKARSGYLIIDTQERQTNTQTKQQKREVTTY